MDERRPVGRWLGFATPALLLAMLEAAVRSGRIDAALVPAPSTVALRLAQMLASGELASPLAQTLALLAAAFALACLLGVALGLAMGRDAFVHGLFEPIVELLRPLPKPALLAPLMLLFGPGAAMKLAIVALAVFFPVLVNTVQGARGVEPLLLDVARTFGHGRLRTLWRVVLPAALPSIVAGMRIGLGLGLVLVVFAEMLGGAGGIGALLVDLQRTFRVAEMYACVVLLATLGYALNALAQVAERRAARWAFDPPG